MKEAREGWLRERWRRLATGDGRGRVRLLVALGVAGIGLIALTELLPSAGDKKTEDTVTAVSADEAELALEARIADLLEEIEGVGDCRVLVTLERDAQTVYAATTTSAGGEGRTSQQILVVDTDSGPVGLPLTTLLPTVKGVAVVCDGGDDPAVCQRVTQVVATAFHISDRRVCVAPLQ